VLIDFTAHGVAHLAKRKLARLLAGGEAVVGHAGFTKRFRHLREVLLPFPRRRSKAEIRQAVAVVIKRVLRLLDKGMRRTVNGSGRKKGE
jgi:hypothetical protein